MAAGGQASSPTDVSGGRRVPLFRRRWCCSQGRENYWSDWVGQFVEPFEGAGDDIGPGPVAGEAEDLAAAGGDELAGPG